MYIIIMIIWMYICWKDEFSILKTTKWGWWVKKVMSSTALGLSEKCLPAHMQTRMQAHTIMCISLTLSLTLTLSLCPSLSSVDRNKRRALKRSSLKTVVCLHGVSYDDYLWHQLGRPQSEAPPRGRARKRHTWTLLTIQTGVYTQPSV